jgi:hypothetical protein
MHELSDLSLWHSTMTADEWGPSRSSLGGSIEADVAIVGAGYTGLWTAYYLAERDPSLRIVVVEAEVAGFGASGRNGGWCSALLPMGLDAMADRLLAAALTSLRAPAARGARDRVRVARALAQDAPVLVLDEPTAFLDVAHEMAVFELLDALAREGRTVLLVSPQLNLVARFAAHLVLLYQGQVAAAGTAAEVMRGELLERVYEWPRPTGGITEVRHVETRDSLGWRMSWRGSCVSMASRLGS